MYYIIYNINNILVTLILVTLYRNILSEVKGDQRDLGREPVRY